MAKSVVPPTFFRRSVGDHSQLFRDHAQLHPERDKWLCPETLRGYRLAQSDIYHQLTTVLTSHPAIASYIGLLGDLAPGDFLLGK